MNIRKNHVPFICLLYVLLMTPAGSLIAQQEVLPEYVHVLSKYIQYKSEFKKEKEAGVYLMQHCKEKGLHTQVLINEDTAFNFTASLFPLSMGKPNIILLNHIDVVSAVDTAAWKFPPYNGEINNGIVWGRGAIDNKGMAVAQLYSMLNLLEAKEKKDMPYNVTLLCVSGEETDGFTGAKPVTERFLSTLNPVLVLGEGGCGVKNIIRSDTSKIVFGISSVEKSKLILELIIKMESSGHASVPPAEYAAKEMIFALGKLLKVERRIIYSPITVKGLKRLAKYEKGIKGFVQRHFTIFIFRPFIKKEIKKDPVLRSIFSNTVTITSLKVPLADYNQISQEVSVMLDCRLMPGIPSERFIRRIKRIIDDPRINVNKITEVMAINRTHHPEFFRMLSNSLLKAYPCSVPVEIIFPATTDNNFFRDKNVPVFGVFPAFLSEEMLSSIHNVNEKISVTSLKSAITVYSDFLNSMMEDGWPKKKRNTVSD